MSKPLSRTLSPDEVERFGAEIDALRARVEADLGERDARYIRNVYKAVRYTEAVGRIMLMVAWFLPEGWVFPVAAIGAVILGLSKIIDNMELGHNVIHGQYDWMGDPHLNGMKFEWDIAGTSDNWRKTHNFRHHTYTNIHGMDEDLGYGVLRLFPEQKWHPARLGQPIYAIIFAMLFEWGVAIQDLRLGRWLTGRVSNKQMYQIAHPALLKMRSQVIKDYLIWPLLAGPGFLVVLAGNAVANVIRSLWTYTVIFCGHFTTDVQTYPKKVLKNDTRAAWYLRQVGGSSNLRGGTLLHFMTGNLSHQIEHHLFPDIPACRYREMAVEVRDICKRYGQHYNTGSLAKQFGQVMWRILRHSFPSSPSRTLTPRMAD
ncbi:MAG TPA: acyl-CoA desaturase [Aquabacterium sp.]|nr:acyl-CoA desaturase [Aquabacterium sp.]